MSTWVAMRQLLVAMEAVERAWGRELGLSRPEMTVLLLVARQPGLATSDVALFCGLRRQHVWRAMTGLTSRRLIHATRRSRRGAEAWSLTPDGLVLTRRFEARLAAWEAIMSRRTDLAEVVLSLQRMVESLVNRPSAEGWASGLSVPHESRLDPSWDLHLESAVLPAAPPPQSLEDRKGADVAEIAEAWHAMWR